LAKTPTRRERERKPLSCQRFSRQPPQYDIVLM